MTTPRWIGQTLLITALLGAGLVAVNARLDIYGLFRDTHGRHLALYDSERRGKYLLNQHYVPQNFDALLLGSSVSSNWNTGGITAVRTYNESTDGGNVTEEKLLLDQYLKSRPCKLAIFVLHPYLTDSHGLSADEMNPREIWAALGSTSLYRAYKAWWSTVRHHAHPDWDDVGTELGQSPDGVKPLNPVLQRIMTSAGEIDIDPRAFDEYRATVDELHANGAKVVFVVPPTSAILLEPHRRRMEGYVERMRPLLSPQDLLIDFDGPGYTSFRADRANYRDGVHLTSRGARELVRMLDRHLQQAGALPAESPTALNH